MRRKCLWGGKPLWFLGAAVCSMASFAECAIDKNPTGQLPEREKSAQEIRAFLEGGEEKGADHEKSAARYRVHTKNIPKDDTKEPKRKNQVEEEAIQILKKEFQKYFEKETSREQALAEIFSGSDSGKPWFMRGDHREDNLKFAEEHGYNPNYMRADVNHRAMREDNIAYMKEIGADRWSKPWNEKYVNPYVSYRHEVNVPKLKAGLEAIANDSYMGCNPAAMFASYMATDVMPTQWTTVSDQTTGENGDCNEIYAAVRTGMYQNAWGTPYKGSEGQMDFTILQHGGFGESRHYDYVFNGVWHGGMGVGGSNSRALSGDNVVAVLTKPDPDWSPQQASAHFQDPLDPLRWTGNPLKASFLGWPSVQRWLRSYEEWEHTHGRGRYSRNWHRKTAYTPNGPVWLTDR